MLIHATALQKLIASIFEAAGSSPAESARIGDYLVRANLTGHDSHGVIRVPRYLRWLQDGHLHPDRRLETVLETDCMAVADGGFGFGQTVGPQAVALGIDKARSSGVSVIALRHSGHLGRIGDWAEMAAEAGLVSIHMVNVSGSVLVAPFGGTERRMATNPLTIGVPVADGPDLILDFATSFVAEGKALVALKGGKALPDGSLIDSDGRATTDPADFYGTSAGDAVPEALGSAALRAMGEHKGSGLSFMIELLAGALTGSGCCGPGERPLVNGMLSIYMAPVSFDTDGYFHREMSQYVAFFKSSRPTEPEGTVMVPGEPERVTRARRLEEGVPLPAETWDSIVAAAQEAGLSPSQIDKIVATRRCPQA